MAEYTAYQEKNVKVVCRASLHRFTTIEKAIEYCLDQGEMCWPMGVLDKHNDIMAKIDKHGNVERFETPEKTVEREKWDEEEEGDAYEN
jgi:hypothetical protein